MGPLGPASRAKQKGEDAHRATRKVDIRLPGKGNSNSHGSRPVHYNDLDDKWIRSSRLSKKNSLSAHRANGLEFEAVGLGIGDCPTPGISVGDCPTGGRLWHRGDFLLVDHAEQLRHHAISNSGFVSRVFDFSFQVPDFNFESRFSVLRFSGRAEKLRPYPGATSVRGVC